MINCLQKHCANKILSLGGGEEFLFILLQTTSAQAKIVADKIREKVKYIPVEHDGSIFEVTVSMGFSEISQQHSSVVDAISSADEYLYIAKESGRDQVQPSEISEISLDITLEVST